MTVQDPVSLFFWARSGHGPASEVEGPRNGVRSGRGPTRPRARQWTDGPFEQQRHGGGRHAVRNRAVPGVAPAPTGLRRSSRHRDPYRSRYDLPGRRKHDRDEVVLAGGGRFLHRHRQRPVRVSATREQGERDVDVDGRAWLQLNGGAGTAGQRSGAARSAVLGPAGDQQHQPPCPRLMPRSATATYPQ